MSLRLSERAEIRHKGYKASVDASEGRRPRYKASVDAREGRRPRYNATVEIRKTDRGRALNEKRQRPDAVPLAAHSSALEKKLDSLPSLVQGVYSDDSSMQLEATTQFRKLLSIELCPPIEEVISSGVVPRFVQFLTREDYSQLQVLHFPWCPCYDARHNGQKQWRQMVQSDNKAHCLMTYHPTWIQQKKA